MLRSFITGVKKGQKMATVKQVLAAISQDGTLGPNQKRFVTEAIQRAETWCKLQEGSKPRKITNAKGLVTLEQWEEINSSLAFPRNNVMGWARSKSLDPDKVMSMVHEFRHEMQAKGKQYANFRMAFITYLTKGYLSLKLSQCHREDTTTIQTRGISL